MSRGKKARGLLKTLDYLPRWAWYTLGFFALGGPFGLIIIYLAFYVLERMASEDEEDEAADGWSRANRTTGSVYADEDCVVSDEGDETFERQWADIEASAHRAQEPPQEEFFAREDASVAEVVREGREALQRMRRADEIIADPELSAKIVSIGESCAQILSILESRPQVLPQLRTFLRYYLPTTLKLLDARAKLENRANTARARQVCARIQDAICAVDAAFKKQVEALDEYRFIDLESEMDVLRDMLRSDGLLDDEQDDDPFAGLNKKRQKRSGGDGMTAGGH